MKRIININISYQLTWIFDSCDNKLESICLSPPLIRDVLQRNKVRVSVDDSHALYCVSASQIRLERDEKFKGE